jgi:hypothetical protein
LILIHLLFIFNLQGEVKLIMKKIILLSAISILLLAISVSPLFNYLREYSLEDQINQRYEIHHAEKVHNIIGVQELTVEGMNIKILEEHTGRKASLTSWDEEENVPPGDIVNIRFLLNDKEITGSDEIWLSNRDRGSRYFSWLDIVTVYDRETAEQQINIVQRLTEDSQPMESRAWKIITISPGGSVKEDILNYSERGNNHLGVKLVNFSGTSLMAMGYYSDITKAYPSLFFPLLYPFLTGMAGIILLIIVLGYAYIQKCLILKRDRRA